jgi:hypothetical protein
MVLARPIGPLWLLLAALVLLAATGPGRLFSLVRRSRRAAIAALGTLAAATALLLTLTAPHRPVLNLEPSLLPRFYGATLAELQLITQSEIGFFGWLDTPLPRLFYAAWAVLLGALVAAALILGTARQRVVLVAITLVSAALPLLLGTFLIGPAGWPGGVQGRYVLPFTVSVPIGAGMTLAGSAERLRRFPPSLVVPALAVGLLTLQAYAWAQNSRRYAIGLRAHVWLSSQVAWSPPSGWLPLVILVLAATAIGAVGAVVAAQAARRGRI